MVRVIVNISEYDFVLGPKGEVGNRGQDGANGTQGIPGLQGLMGPPGYKGKDKQYLWSF